MGFPDGRLISVIQQVQNIQIIEEADQSSTGEVESFSTYLGRLPAQCVKRASYSVQLAVSLTTATSFFTVSV